MNLTNDQQNAVHEFTSFLMNEDEKYFVIGGRSGSGKSTLIQYLLDTVPDTMKLLKLVKQDNTRMNIALTATTHKAAAVLNEVVEGRAITVHSFLGLTLKENYTTGEVDLILGKSAVLQSNVLLFIDEASFINDQLFKYINMLMAKDCKVVLIGDQYQLAPVKQKVTIMEKIQCNKIYLTQIMRNSGSIMTVGDQFRDTVRVGAFKPIIPVDDKLRIVNGDEFQKLIKESFLNYHHIDNYTKILAWSNSKVIEYNNYIRKILGYPEELTEGEIVVTNRPIMTSSIYVPIEGHVTIETIGGDTDIEGVKGNYILLTNGYRAFMAKNQVDEKSLLSKYAKEKDWKTYFEIKNNWLDLRPAYACTVHKSQGSTYNTTFIDLVNIGKCNITSDVARMLYVAITRSSNKVILYGKLPLKYGGG